MSASEVEEDSSAEEIAELRKRIVSLQQALAKRTRDDVISEELENIAARIERQIVAERGLLEQAITGVNENVEEIKENSELIEKIRFSVDRLVVGMDESNKYWNKSEVTRLQDDIERLLKKADEIYSAVPSVDFLKEEIVRAL